MMNIFQRLRSFIEPLRLLVLGVAGSMLLYQGATQSLSLHHLRSVGQSAVVEPITQYTRHRQNKVTTFSAEIGFTTRQGERVQQERTFPNELLADFEAGRPVQILYDPTQPSDFTFEKDDWPWFNLLSGLVLLVLAGLHARALWAAEWQEARSKEHAR